MFKQDTYTFEQGYFANSELVNVPDGGFINPSANVLFSKSGRLLSYKGATSTFSDGGTRVSVLDKNLIGVMGVDDSTNAAQGNMIQGIGRSLWFVGNTNADTSMVRVYDTDTDTTTDIGALSSTPQVAYRNSGGTGWDAPVQVGLSEQLDPPILTLTDDNARSAGFDGIITGSISARIARVRKGVVSIASPASNVVEADGDSVRVNIPAPTLDGFDTWWLYFTVAGRGSQLSHLMFPLELTEDEVDGTDTPALRTSGNAKLFVVDQDPSNPNNRIVEIEYYANDLNAIEPFEDYYPAESCKFVAQLGNVLMLFGTGDDGTGFDVSYPNNHEAFPPDWRDWLPEQPIAICPAPEAGFVWVCTANTIFQAGWAGTTQQTAPVVLRQISNKYGCIGEQAVCNVNGALFAVSRGNTPIMVSPDGNIDVNFGAQVADVFSSYTEDCLVNYDEETNSVVFMNGSSGIAFNLTTQRWGAPLALGVTPVSSFALNGKLYLTYYTAFVNWASYRFNYGSDSTWNLTSNFRPLAGMDLFDIVEVRALLESSNTSGTVTIASLKNWSTSSPRTLTTYTFTAAGVKARTWALVEVLDLESLSVKVSGTKGGELVHAVLIQTHPHTIRRGT